MRVFIIIHTLTPTPQLYDVYRISFPRTSRSIWSHVLIVHKHGRSKDTFRLFSESGFRLPRLGLTLSPEDGWRGIYSVRRHRLRLREHDDLLSRVHLAPTRLREHTNRLVCLPRRYLPSRPNARLLYNSQI